MTPLTFVDCETTGLDPELHEIWEVGLILRLENGDESEHHWFLEVNLGVADPMALKIGGYHDRHPARHPGSGLAGGAGGGSGARHPASAVAGAVAGGGGGGGSINDLHKSRATHPSWVARDIAYLTRGTHLVGNVISFDEERLRKLLRTYGECPMWHYHLVDVEAMAAGALGVAPPWDSEDLSRALGIEPPGEVDRHTALGDARWAMLMYDAVLDRHKGQVPDVLIRQLHSGTPGVGRVVRPAKRREKHLCDVPSEEWAREFEDGSVVAPYPPGTVWECGTCKHQWVVTRHGGWRRKWWTVPILEA